MDLKQTPAYSAGSLLFNYALDGNMYKLKEALAGGGPLGTDTVGTTALHCAVIGNQLEICEVLLRAGLGVDLRTKVDRTPLHLAAYHGHEAIAKMLLDKKCKVDPLDLFQMTPLHWAVEKGFPGVCRLLLNRGADPHALSKFNKTPWSMAEAEDKREIMHIFEMVSAGEGQREANEATASLVLAMKRERDDPRAMVAATTERHMTEIVDYYEEDEDEENVDEENEDDIEVETMSMFDEAEESEAVAEVEEEDVDDEDDDVVEVIPVLADIDSVDNTMENGEAERSVVAQDSDESFSNLHETINKLGNIRGM